MAEPLHFPEVTEPMLAPRCGSGGAGRLDRKTRNDQPKEELFDGAGCGIPVIQPCRVGDRGAQRVMHHRPNGGHDGPDAERVRDRPISADGDLAHEIAIADHRPAVIPRTTRDQAGMVYVRP